MKRSDVILQPCLSQLRCQINKNAAKKNLVYLCPRLSKVTLNYVPFQFHLHPLFRCVRWKGRFLFFYFLHHCWKPCGRTIDCLNFLPVPWGGRTEWLPIEKSHGPLRRSSQCKAKKREEVGKEGDEEEEILWGKKGGGLGVQQVFIHAFWELGFGGTETSWEAPDERTAGVSLLISKWKDAPQHMSDRNYKAACCQSSLIFNI